MDFIDPVSQSVSTFKTIDDPWIGLLVLGSLIFIIPIIAILVFCFLWRRYQKFKPIQNENYILGNKPTGKIPIPVQIQEQPQKAYETQVYFSQLLSIFF